MGRLFGILLLALSSSCHRPPVGADGSAGDLLPPAPTHLDLLFVVSTGYGGPMASGFEVTLSHAIVSALLRQEPASITRDLRIGVISSKLDMKEICARNEQITHDGTLMIPIPDRISRLPPLDWPADMTEDWPPRWSFLEGSLTAKLDLAGLTSIYVEQAIESVNSLEGPCGVTQYLEAAARSLDGRNATFFRPGALVAVVVLSDGEDCSTLNTALWDRALWRKEFLSPNARCYEPPEGLLHPVTRYLELLRRLDPPRRAHLTLVAVDRPPKWYDEPDGSRSQLPVCATSFLPSRRLPLLARLAAASPDPRLSVSFVDGCSAYPSAGVEAGNTIAGSIGSALRAP